MNKIKKYLMKIFYGLPFGLKGADSEILGGHGSDDLGTNVNQEISDERVAKHLLKGEITQEVEELRYRTYKVSNESEKYKYLGNGVAIKNDDETIDDNERRRYKFTQSNENICESVLQTLNQVGSYGAEKYRFEIEYSEFSRFKIEKFATMVDVLIDKNIGEIKTTLHFNKNENPYDGTSKPFINELEKTYNSRNEHELKRSEIANVIKSLSFSTYKASNEDDFVTYCFSGGGKYIGMRENKNEYLMVLEWNEFMRVPLNLEVKYYSKTMARKYANKERKAAVVSLVDAERKRYCSICGNEMSVYDADIQEASGEQVICKECAEKIMKENSKQDGNDRN